MSNKFMLLNYMIKLLILKLLNIFKSLINLLLRLIIKLIKTFSFIILIKKYYSYFKIIFNTLKKFEHYYIFKYFIKSLGIFNILLSVFTIFILTDYQNHDYIKILEQYLNQNELFISIRKYLKRILKYLIDLFSIDNFPDGNVENNLPKGGNKIPQEEGKYFTFYVSCFIVLTLFSIGIYKSNIIDFNLITTYINTFFNNLFSKGGDDPGISDNEDITLTDNRISKDNIPNIIITEPDVKTDNIPSIQSVLTTETLPGSFPDDSSIPSVKKATVFYTEETGDSAKALENRLNEILGKK